MEQEPVALGQDVQVVDPDVRGYVYSLVTAVSASLPAPFLPTVDSHKVVIN